MQTLSKQDHIDLKKIYDRLVALSTPGSLECGCKDSTKEDCSLFIRTWILPTIDRLKRKSDPTLMPKLKPVHYSYTKKDT